MAFASSIGTIPYITTVKEERRKLREYFAIKTSQMAAVRTLQRSHWEKCAVLDLLIEQTLLTLLSTRG
jgi:hypothetical protein